MNANTAARALPGHPLLRFGLVGAANTVAGLTLIFFFKHVIGFGDVLSNVLGYAIMVPVSFALNRRWTFGHDGVAGAAFARYLLVLVSAYVANLAAVVLLIGWSVPGDLAQLCAVALYALIGYVCSRHFVFRARERA